MSHTIALKCRLKARPNITSNGGDVIGTTAAASAATTPPTTSSWYRGLAPPPAFPSPSSTILPMPISAKMMTTPPKMKNEQQQKHHRGVSPLLTTPPSSPTDEDDEEAAEGVQLLLGIATIVKKEVADSGYKNEVSFFQDETTTASTPPRATHHQGSRILTPPSPPKRVGLLDRDDDGHDGDDDMYAWNRARSVSIDSPQHHHQQQQQHAHGGYGYGYSPQQQNYTLSSPPPACPLPTMISPLIDRSKRSMKLTSRNHQGVKSVPVKAKKEHVKFPKLPQLTPVCTVEDYTRKAVKIAQQNGTVITTISRKKFSWKNYPELEAFLVANREEYLRHSALNYTVQQKQYNNRLTERLLELAAQHGYVFDNTEFNFVTVRDRIRCFYKSYVQSSKKRGIVLGYAARKAGILTTADLQKSARQEATIYTPEDL
eukprot:CAMPEP_0113496954 /NCGR_PEP_ID=MMETSP0014_2-20120614/30383_1 /TAXON_ID=2857 /ORGANISM="Nitzschia sp." /LENGTH=428 /DNA_ID=CAMNT_0000390883 /DNA_START=178 /DNA_END=1464 /DNA_ORIENTATION=- /assembly_acc=CAM_ASM_000159